MKIEFETIVLERDTETQRETQDSLQSIFLEEIELDGYL